MTAAPALPAPAFLGRRTLLPALIIVTIVLRCGLAWSGGQFFFPDEWRYRRSVALYLALRQGDMPVIRTLLAQPDHLGFTVLGVGIAALQHLTSQVTGQGDWSRFGNITATFRLGAMWLALLSSLDIWLVARVARAAGAGPGEELWAALLIACSNTAFYYTRHFLPYDAGLCAILAAIWVGLRERHSLVCGLLAGTAYLIYNGYWYVVPVIVGMHALAPASFAVVRWRRAAVCIAGAGVALALSLMVGWVFGGRDYWDQLLAFSRSANQGVFSEGWSLPWGYLWHSERLLGLAVVAVIVAAAVVARRSGQKIERRLILWTGMLAAAYGLLVVTSVVLHRFVVYGRTVHPFVPLFCLAGGWAFARLIRDGLWRTIAVVSLCAAAAANLSLPFLLVFPADIEAQVQRTFGNPLRASAVIGTQIYPLPAQPVNRPDLVLVNTQFLYPATGYIGYPAGTTLLKVPHPLSYPPYQYEGHTPAERELLRTHDISIRLIQLAAPANEPAKPMANRPAAVRRGEPDR